MIDPLMMTGAVAGGLVLLELVGGPKGLVKSRSPGSDAVLGLMPPTIEGLPYAKPKSGSPIDLFAVQRGTLIALYGFQVDALGVGIYPARMPLAALQRFVDLWLAAFDAGAAASPADFVLRSDSDCGARGTVFGDLCHAIEEKSNPEDMNALGKAHAALVDWHNALTFLVGAEELVDAARTRTTFQLVLRLAGEIEGVSFAFPGTRPSEQVGPSILGGLGAAFGASVDFVGGVAGNAAGAVAGSLFGSPMFWAAVLAVAAYKVLL